MNLIVLKKISKIYKMGKVEVPALVDADLQIKKGEYLAIMGPSGSGKSTLMNVLGCLDVPTSGEYYLDSKDVGKLNDVEMASIRNQMIGFVFQTFNLLPRLNARKNVELPLIYAGVKRQERHIRADKLLESVGLSGRAEHLPSELSGGERQRVAIARSLANDPHLILADEPTGNLDSKSGEEIMKIFDSLNKSGVTIIVVTHENFIAEHADKSIHILDGRIERIEVHKK
ncbi:ABC transporter ATP-binding protein [bacterium]|nr:ABC transporter ATP-binding protein [bacterium]